MTTDPRTILECMEQVSPLGNLLGVRVTVIDKE